MDQNTEESTQPYILYFTIVLCAILELLKLLTHPTLKQLAKALAINNIRFGLQLTPRKAHNVAH